MAKAIHAFCLNSGDPDQESVLVMLLPSTIGMVKGVSGLSETEAELKTTISSILTDLSQPILSVSDGDRDNCYCPQALAAAALSRLGRV